MMSVLGARAAELSDREIDMMDWGFAFGVAWAVARSQDPAAPEELVSIRALDATQAVYDAYRGSPAPAQAARTLTARLRPGSAAQPHAHRCGAPDARDLRTQHQLARLARNAQATQCERGPPGGLSANRRSRSRVRKRPLLAWRTARTRAHPPRRRSMIRTFRDPGTDTPPDQHHPAAGPHEPPQGTQRHGACASRRPACRPAADPARRRTAVRSAEQPGGSPAPAAAPSPEGRDGRAAGRTGCRPAA